MIKHDIGFVVDDCRLWAKSAEECTDVGVGCLFSGISPACVLLEAELEDCVQLLKMFSWKGPYYAAYSMNATIIYSVTF